MNNLKLDSIASCNKIWLVFLGLRW